MVQKIKNEKIKLILVFLLSIIFWFTVMSYTHDIYYINDNVLVMQIIASLIVILAFSYFIILIFEAINFYKTIFKENRKMNKLEKANAILNILNIIFLLIVITITIILIPLCKLINATIHNGIQKWTDFFYVSHACMRTIFFLSSITLLLSIYKFSFSMILLKRKKLKIQSQN